MARATFITLLEFAGERAQSIRDVRAASELRFSYIVLRTASLVHM